MNNHFSTSDVVKFTGYCEATIRMYAQTGIIEGVKFKHTDNAWFFTESTVRQLLKKAGKPADIHLTHSSCRNHPDFNPKDSYTTEQVCELLRIGLSSARKYAKNGHIPAGKIPPVDGNFKGLPINRWHWRFDKKSVDKLVQARTNEQTDLLNDNLPYLLTQPNKEKTMCIMTVTSATSKTKTENKQVHTMAHILVYQYNDVNELPRAKGMYDWEKDCYSEKAGDLLDEIATRVENNLVSIFQLQSVGTEEDSNCEYICYQNDCIGLTITRGKSYGAFTTLKFCPIGKSSITDEVENGIEILSKLHPKLDCKLISVSAPLPRQNVNEICNNKKIESFILTYINNKSKPTFKDICNDAANFFECPIPNIAIALEAGNGKKWTIRNDKRKSITGLN